MDIITVYFAVKTAMSIGLPVMMIRPTDIEHDLDKLKDKMILKSTKLRKYLIEFSKKLSEHDVDRFIVPYFDFRAGFNPHTVSNNKCSMLMHTATLLSEESGLDDARHAFAVSSGHKHKEDDSSELVFYSKYEYNVFYCQQLHVLL